MNQRMKPRVGDMVLFRGTPHDGPQTEECAALVLGVTDDQTVDLVCYWPHGQLAGQPGCRHVSIVASPDASCWYERLPAVPLNPANEPEKE